MRTAGRMSIARALPLFASLTVALVGCGSNTAYEEGEVASPGSSDNGIPGFDSGDDDGDNGVSATIDGVPMHWTPGPDGGAAYVGDDTWAYQVFVGRGDPALLIIDVGVDGVGALDCEEQPDASRQAHITVLTDNETTTHTMGTGSNVGTCAINIAVATGAGGRYEGTFSGTLVAEGEPDMVITDGAFALDVNE